MLDADMRGGDPAGFARKATTSPATFCTSIIIGALAESGRRSNRVSAFNTPTSAGRYRQPIRLVNVREDKPRCVIPTHGALCEHLAKPARPQRCEPMMAQVDRMPKWAGSACDTTRKKELPRFPNHFSSPSKTSIKMIESIGLVNHRFRPNCLSGGAVLPPGRLGRASNDPRHTRRTRFPGESSIVSGARRASAEAPEPCGCTTLHGSGSHRIGRLHGPRQLRHQSRGRRERRL
jgi:hypothetical protein